jgi:hypothetical protein
LPTVTSSRSCRLLVPKDAAAQTHAVGLTDRYTLSV